jgi:hypothetical protein
MSCFFLVSEVLAAKLQLLITTTAFPYVFTLKIDKAEKLAGMKLTITYPEQYLEFKTAEKTSTFNSFMHVINDKNPGKLVIVMASAKGVSGDDLKLFDFTFSPIPGNPAVSYRIEPMECQLMSENLQEIPCEASSTSIAPEQ